MPFPPDDHDRPAESNPEDFPRREPSRRTPDPDNGPEYDHLGDSRYADEGPRTAPYDAYMDNRAIERRGDYEPSEFDMSDEQLGGEMGFFDHLEELRTRIIRSLIAVILTSILCAFFLNDLMDKVLLGPANRVNPPLKLQNFEPMGQITLALQVVMISGLILAVPIILWQFWGFIRPGLYAKEKKLAGVIALATIFCFVVGVVFAYFVLLPASLEFTNSMKFAGIENRFAISSYFSMVLGLILACGVIFELPMLSYALARFGILTTDFMRKYRRHAAVVILIIAAVITPTPDPINQLFLAVPLYALYEISILVTKLAFRHRQDAMQVEA
jgi:sec-independent protein translocase protein TatC